MILSLFRIPCISLIILIFISFFSCVLANIVKKEDYVVGVFTVEAVRENDRLIVYNKNVTLSDLSRGSYMENQESARWNLKFELNYQNIKLKFLTRNLTTFINKILLYKTKDDFIIHYEKQLDFPAFISANGFNLYDTSRAHQFNCMSFDPVFPVSVYFHNDTARVPSFKEFVMNETLHQPIYTAIVQSCSDHLSGTLRCYNMSNHEYYDKISITSFYISDYFYVFKSNTDNLLRDLLLNDDIHWVIVFNFQFKFKATQTPVSILEQEKAGFIVNEDKYEFESSKLKERYKIETFETCGMLSVELEFSVYRTVARGFGNSCECTIEDKKTVLAQFFMLSNDVDTYMVTSDLGILGTVLKLPYVYHTKNCDQIFCYNEDHNLFVGLENDGWEEIYFENTIIKNNADFTFKIENFKPVEHVFVSFDNMKTGDYVLGGPFVCDPGTNVTRLRNLSPTSVPSESQTNNSKKLKNSIYDFLLLFVLHAVL